MKRRAFLRFGSAAAASAAVRASQGASAVQRTGPGAPLAVYPDGTARINALLGASLNAVIPAGIYMVTGELNVRDGHIVAAANGARVVLKAAPTYTGRMILSYDKSFTLRGLTFDGARADRRGLEGTEVASLLQIIGGTNVTLEGNTFQYAPSYAVWTWRSASMQVRGNTFLECWHPIRIDAANLPSGGIENNTFQNTAAYKSMNHIDAMATVDLVVRGNTMQGAGLAEPTSHGYEGTWGNSIFLTKGTGYLVESNRVNVNHWSAMVSGAGAKNGIIRNNYFSEGAVCTAALWIEQPGAAYITVDNNELDGGISCGDTGGDHLTITNNRIRSRSVGIDVNWGCRTALFQGNTISSKAGHRFNNGMYLWQKNTPQVNVRVLDNRIEGFDKGIAINNPGGVGTVYGIHLNGNTFSNVNVAVWIPRQIKTDSMSQVAR